MVSEPSASLLFLDQIKNLSTTNIRRPIPCPKMLHRLSDMQLWQNNGKKKSGPSGGMTARTGSLRSEYLMTEEFTFLDAWRQNSFPPRLPTMDCLF